VLLAAAAASAQPVDVPATWGGSLSERPRLTGSWGGVRDEMGKKGVVLDVDLTQVLQGVASGGREQQAEYGGLAEYTLNIDTGKLGLWPGGFFQAQGMTNYGLYVNEASGAVIPPNLISILPAGPDVSGLMNLTFMQFLSKKFGVFAGKASGLGGDDNAFAHDYHSQFLNSGLNFNMALDLFPFTSYGGGIVVLPWDGAIISASVLDPSGSATNNDISEAFEDGVLLATETRIEVSPFGKTGHQLVGFAWSNKERVSLEQDPANIARGLLSERFPRLQDPGPILERILRRNLPGLLVPVQPLSTDDSTWTVYYNFDQFVWNPDGKSDRGVGIFARFGAADPKTSPVQYACNFGVGGKGVVPGRPDDQFGIGWSGLAVSNDYAAFLRRALDLGLTYENAFEVYYDAALTRSIGATLDVQVIDPGLRKKLDSGGNLVGMNPSVVLGLRIYVRL